LHALSFLLTAFFFADARRHHLTLQLEVMYSCTESAVCRCLVQFLHVLSREAKLNKNNAKKSKKREKNKHHKISRFAALICNRKAAQILQTTANKYKQN